jgi:hypothetical protein
MDLTQTHMNMQSVRATTRPFDTVDTFAGTIRITT